MRLTRLFFRPVVLFYCPVSIAEKSSLRGHDPALQWSERAFRGLGGSTNSAEETLESRRFSTASHTFSFFATFGMTNWEEQPPPYDMDNGSDVTASELEDPYRVIEQLTGENQQLNNERLRLEQLVNALSDPLSNESQQVHQAIVAEAAMFKEDAENYCFEVLREAETAHKSRASARESEVEKQLLELRQELLQGQKELNCATAGLQSLESHHESESSRLRGILDRRRDTIKRLKSALDEKKFQRKENRKKVMTENVELKTSIGNLQKEAKKLEKSNGDLQSQLSSTRKWATRLEETEQTLQLELETLRKENVRLNCDFEDLQSDREDEDLLDDGSRDWQTLQDQMHRQHAELAAVANIINLHVSDQTVLTALRNAVESVRSGEKRPKRRERDRGGGDGKAESEGAEGGSDTGSDTEENQTQSKRCKL